MSAFFFFFFFLLPRPPPRRAGGRAPPRGGGGGGGGGGVGGDAVLPAAPDHAAPGAAEAADRARVVVAAGSGRGVAVLGPGVPVTSRVGEGAGRGSQPLVAAVAEGRDLLFAGFDRDGGHAGVGGERVRGGVALAAVADLGQQRRGGDHALGVFEQREEDLPVGVGA